MKIRKVEIEGFRAYRKKADGLFDFTLPDGSPASFVTIFAPNGFGKSSFYDAVEWAFTNNVERYIREPHRVYNETAARGTKVASEPQYILRNNEIPANWPTSVTVDTTLRPFHRALPTIRSDSRDLRFTENQTEEDSQKFRRIFLSQDAIDSFLRETKPEDRYIDFMESFGSATEQTRHELHVIKQDNKGIIDALRQERMQLESRLQEPIDTEVFAAYNITADKLSTLGEHVSHIDDDFSTIKEHEILSQTITRKNHLTNQFEETSASKLSLQQKLGLQEDLRRAKESKIKASTEVTKYQKWVSDSERYQRLYSTENSEREHLGEILASLEYHHYLRNTAAYYIKIKEERLKSREKIDHIGKQLETINFSIANERTQKDNIEKRLLELNEKTLEWNTLKSQATGIYAEIASNQSLLEHLEAGHSTSLSEEALTEGSISQLNVQLEKYRKIKIDRQFYESEDALILNIKPELLSLLQSHDQSSNSLELQIQGLFISQELLNQHSSQIDNLISIGLDIIREHTPSACPLCSTPFKSVDDLTNSIHSNKHLSQVVKNNERLISELTSSKKLADESLSLAISSLEAIRDDAILKVNSALQTLLTRKSNLETEISDISLKITSTIERIDSLRSRTFNLPLKTLEEKISSERLLLENEISENSKTLTKCTLAIRDSETKGAELGSQILSSAQRISAIESDTDYINHSAEPTSNDGSLESIIATYEGKIINLQNDKEETLTSTGQINELLKNLHSEMLLEGSWQPRETLAGLLNRAREELATFESYIAEYYTDLAKLLGRNIEDTLDLSETLNNEIEKISITEKSIRDRIFLYIELEDQLKAFAPYVEHIKLRQRLSEVMTESHQHEKLDEKLKQELTQIADHLKAQIKSFFFTDLINSIYKKIDPHPSFTEIDFDCDFDVDSRPKLNVVIKDTSLNQVISPNLYFSAAQLNILSLSIFLARALHAEYNDNSLDVILIDDPIHSMDSINILSTIDLLRSVSLRFGKQIIISTHDENFYELLKKKIPPIEFSSKFLRLPTFGVVEPDVA